MNMNGALRKHTEILCAIAAIVAALLLMVSILSISDTSAAVDTVEKDSTDTTGNTYIDINGDFKLKYTVVSSTDKTVKISGYSYSGTTATAVTFPAKIVYDSVEYQVIGIPDDSAYWTTNPFMKTAKVSELTIEVSYSSYVLPSDFMKNNTYLTKVTFKVEGDDPEGNGKVSIGDSAFDGCTNLVDLTLPEVLSQVGVTIFANCTKLGSDCTSENPFIFNTKIVKYKSSEYDKCYLFTGCTGLVYLELGKNVNIIDGIFSPRNDRGVVYSGCSSIKVVYNAGTKISQGDVEASVVESGSYNVLIFYFCGGDLTKGATISGTSFTMPKGTLNDIEIPSWTPRDGTNKYLGGVEYSSFSPWSTSTADDSYYYFTLYGSCTVNYHVTYKDSSGNVVTSTVSQEVVCMYNSLLYGKDNYPDSTVSGKMSSSFEWTSSTGTKYLSGQSVTIYSDLDLYLNLDSTTSGDITITYQFDYTYVYTDWKTQKTTYTVYTYTAKITASAGTSVSLLTNSGFQNYITGTAAYDAKSAFSSYDLWAAPDGTVYNMGGSATFYGDITLTPVVSKYTVVYYSNTTADEVLTFNSARASVTINANTFFNGNAHFVCWNTDKDGSGTNYYPEDVTTISGTLALYAIWSIDTEIDVTYNLYKDSTGKYVSETDTYTYGDLVNLPNFLRRGYTLVGWSYTQSQHVNFATGSQVTMLKDLTLYAVWSENQLTIVVDNKLVSVKDIGPLTYGYTVLGDLVSGDTVKLTVTLKDADGNVVENPTAVGVYTIEAGYQVFDSNGKDVTGEYYSGYDGSTPVTFQCYSGFLAIYSGNPSIIIG